MIGFARAAIVAFTLTVTTMATAHADEATDKAAILERLQRWTADFNANNHVGVCDLFAPDLIYSIPEVAQGTRSTLCANLAATLAKPEVKLRYANPDVHEIIVVGDVAVVRLTWTLIGLAAPAVAPRPGCAWSSRSRNGACRTIAWTKSSSLNATPLPSIASQANRQAGALTARAELPGRKVDSQPSLQYFAPVLNDAGLFETKPVPRR
jgi:uncharacterized protein DUF4440